MMLGERAEVSALNLKRVEKRGLVKRDGDRSRRGPY